MPTNQELPLLVFLRHSVGPLIEESVYFVHGTLYLVGLLV